MGLLSKLFGGSGEDKKTDAQEGAATSGTATVAGDASVATSEKTMVPPERVDEVVEAIKDATRMQAYRLRIDETITPTLTSSKLGGLPYWPAGMAYPEPERKGLSADERLALLAQLNLADFGGDPRLPNQGLLQFFVTTDDLNGLEFDVPMDAQRHFRVVWHENVDATITAQDVLDRGITPAASDDIFPVAGEHALAISQTESWMTPSDERFDAVFSRVCTTLFGAGYDDEKRAWHNYLDDAGCDKIDELFNTGNDLQNLVLGYPFFTQWDPRSGDDLEYFDTLLLQLDSDLSTPSKVMWGDSGVGAFFINGEALAKGDFGRVLYNWDCY